MIILSLKGLPDLVAWDAVGQEVMNSLDIKRLLDLGIRSEVEMQQDETRQ
jgi:hypothetical protein